MMTLNISGAEYKIRFGMNDFANSDLLDRVQDMAVFFNDDTIKSFADLRTLFVVVRELIYLGFRRDNPVEDVDAVGDLLDTYLGETPKDENGNALEERGLLALFIQLSNELASEGFLADFMETMASAMESSKVQKMPQDHKKSTKKK